MKGSIIRISRRLLMSLRTFLFLLTILLACHVATGLSDEKTSDIRWQILQRSKTNDVLQAVSANGDRLVIERPGERLEVPCALATGKQCKYFTSYLEIRASLDGPPLVSHQFLYDAYVTRAHFEDVFLVKGSLVTDEFKKTGHYEREYYLLTVEGELILLSDAYKEVDSLKALWDRDTAFVCNEKSPAKHYPQVCGVYNFSTSRFTPWVEVRPRGLSKILTGTSRKEVYDCRPGGGEVYRYRNEAGVVSRELVVTLEDLSIKDCSLSPDGSLLLIMTGSSGAIDRWDIQPEFLVWDLRNGSVKGRISLLKDEYKSSSRVTLENVKTIDTREIIAVSNRIAAIAYVREVRDKLIVVPRRQVCVSILDLEKMQQVGTVTEPGWIPHILDWEDRAGLGWPRQIAAFLSGSNRLLVSSDRMSLVEINY